MKTRTLQLAAKRTIDIALAGATLLAFLPVLGCVALAIRWRLGSPILFRQQRPGRQGRPFVLYKFRTMNDNRDANGGLLPDGERLTRLGKFLRRASLDELPQLWNVLRGDMSLVGPRPLLMEYLDYYTSDQARRHEVTPGITGWAQINGRNAITWEDKFAFDTWYVANWSFWLDLWILARTVWQVVRGAGISAPTHPTMPKLTATKERWNPSTS